MVFLAWQVVGNAVAATAVELVAAVGQDVPALSCLPSEVFGHIVVAVAAAVAEPVAVAE